MATLSQKYQLSFSKSNSYPPDIVSLDNKNQNLYVLNPINHYLQILDYHGKVVDYIDLQDVQNNRINHLNTQSNYGSRHLCALNKQLIAVWSQSSIQIVQDIKKNNFQDQFRVLNIAKQQDKILTNLVYVNQNQNKNKNSNNNIFCYFSQDLQKNFHEINDNKIKINFLQVNLQIKDQKKSQTQTLIQQQQNPQYSYNELTFNQEQKSFQANTFQIASCEIQMPYQISCLQNCRLHFLQNQSSERVFTILNQFSRLQVQENINHQESSIEFMIYDIQRQYFQKNSIMSYQNNRRALNSSNFQKAIQLSPNLLGIYGKFNQIILYDLRNSKIVNFIKIMDNHLIYEQSLENSICKKQNSFWNLFINMGRNINQIDLRRPQNLVQTVIQSNQDVQSFLILNQKISLKNNKDKATFCFIVDGVGKINGYESMKN